MEKKDIKILTAQELVKKLEWLQEELRTPHDIKIQTNKAREDIQALTNTMMHTLMTFNKHRPFLDGMK